MLAKCYCSLRYLTSGEKVGGWACSQILRCFRFPPLITSWYSTLMWARHTCSFSSSIQYLSSETKPWPEMCLSCTFPPGKYPTYSSWPNSNASSAVKLCPSPPGIINHVLPCVLSELCSGCYSNMHHILLCLILYVPLSATRLWGQ